MSLLALLVAATGILLAPLAFLAALSGYCMKSETLIGTLTLGLMGEYALCSLIHLDLVADYLVIVGCIHVMVVAESLYGKYGGFNGFLKILLYVYRVIAWSASLLMIGVALTFLLL